MGQEAAMHVEEEAETRLARLVRGWQHLVAAATHRHIIPSRRRSFVAQDVPTLCFSSSHGNLLLLSFFSIL